MSAINEQFLTEMLADVAAMFTGRHEVGEVLYRFADHLVAALGLAGAGVALADPTGRMHAATGVNELSAALETEETRLQQGPCIDAYATCETVTVDDLSTATASWPEWSREAQRRGVLAVAAFPLCVKDLPLGAVNLYSPEMRHWDAETVRTCRVLADLTASYVANRWELADSRRTTEQLQHALDSRVVIEQAKGVLASHMSCSVDHAFTVLRDYARSHRASLRSVADAVVQGRFRPPTID